jgi:hypothetical protein
MSRQTATLLLPSFIAQRSPQNLAVTYILGVSYASEGAEVSRVVAVVLEKDLMLFRASVG